MAFFRIVVADSRAPRDGRFIEQLGYYDPLKEPAVIDVQSEKAIGWLQKGAQPSETVRSLFSRIGLMETWNEMKKGRAYAELTHIEEEARKKTEARAAMERRAKDDKQQKKQAEVETPGAPESGAAPEPTEDAAVAEVGAEAPDESGEAAVEPAEDEVPKEAPAEEPTAESEPAGEKPADEQGSADGDETKADA